MIIERQALNDKIEEDKIQKALLKVAKHEWLNNITTRDLLLKLEKEYFTLVEQAENLSESGAQLDKDKVILKINCARKVKQIINYVKE